jgi:MFS family permease
MGLAMFGFVLASKIDSNTGFIIIAFITRFIQGFASSTIQTTCFSMSGLLYSENQAAVIGLLEMSSGIGMTISPVIGSLLYKFGGFDLPFIFFGCLFLFSALVIKLIIPDTDEIKQDKAKSKKKGEQK